MAATIVSAVILTLSLPTVAQALTLNWTTPVNVATATFIDEPVTAVNNSGLFVMAWVESDGTTQEVKAATSSDGKSWSTPVATAATATNLQNLRLAVNSTGIFALVYRVADMPNSRLYSMASTDGQTWSTPAMIGNTSRDYALPKLSASGPNFEVAWIGDVGASGYTSNILYAATSTNGTTWSSPAAISDDTSGYVANQQVLAPLPGGGFVVAYHSDRPGYVAIVVRTTSDGVTWSTGSTAWGTIVSPSGAVGNAPSIAVSPQGRILVTYLASAGAVSSAYATSSTDGTTWSTPVMIGDGIADDLAFPHIAVNSAGRFLVMWNSSLSGSNQIVVTRSTTDGSTFTPRRELTANTSTAYWPVPVATPSGSFVATWVVDDGLGNQTRTSAVTDDGINWSQQQNLPYPGILMSNPSLAVNAQGAVLMAWSVSPVISNYSLYTSTLTVGTDPALAETGSDATAWLTFAALSLIAGCLLKLAVSLSNRSR
ncbi:sialidase family protein [Aurantimicrobium minutum]|uniref:sialidase family protein n=1 Tax=Aurantimicrobium minutum TaxID=708131 RepID=UPI002476184C|nr:sialidase family protein [Aurantimicrobium minutum]MDH6423187.1 hypothetical protein [Aurantimicrobium minutum]